MEAFDKSRRAETIYDVRERAKADFESLGLRERHKIDKLDRISAAALLLFSRDGYEGARLRDIAKEAGVALGTLGLYARDKRDLILLLFNKLIPPLLEMGREKPKSGQRLAESMATYFTPFYETYAENIPLYRMILGHIFGPNTEHAQENREIRVTLTADIADLIKRAIETGECSPDVDLVTQPQSFFYLYFASVRQWLSQENPRPEEGIAELQRIYEQHVRGLAAR